MQVVRRDGNPTIALDDGPLVNFCKPAVDPLFKFSGGDLEREESRPSLLTGMGSDGTRGAIKADRGGRNRDRAG